MVNASEGKERFDSRVQRDYFEEAEIEHFRWTTAGPGFHQTEDDLLAPICAELEGPCLEIGCGEGNNLARLARHGDCYGVDLFPKKLSFASREIPGARFTTASADRLPFADASFRTLLIRDLLHHVEDPGAVLEEAMRVLAPGGRFWLLEPNARSPIVRLQISLVPAESGARKFNAEYVAGLLADLPLEDTRISAEQPFPLRRVLFHYELGLPGLGNSRLATRLIAGAEKLLGSLVPSSYHCYVVAAARRS